MLALIVTLGFVSGGFASILCPTTFNPNQTIHLPHPTDCAKFLTCVGTYPVEQDCPAGLQWNEEASFCDYPRSPRCTRSSDGRSFNAAAVASSVCLPQTYQCPMNSKPTENVIFLKHRDCRKFYACVSTHPVELSCPPKLYWNSQNCVCDYEMEADCDEMMARAEEAPEEEQAPEQAEQSEADHSDNEEPEEDADEEQAEQPESESDNEAPEEDDDADAPVAVRKRRDTDTSSSSSNGTSTNSGSGSSGSESSGSGSSGSGSSGSGSSGSGSSGSGSSGSGSSGSIAQSGASEIQTVSSVVMIVATVIMSSF